MKEASCAGSPVQGCSARPAGILAGCALSPPPAAPIPGLDDPRTAFVCPQPTVGPLPVWARTGFTPSDQPVAHLVSVEGHIVAVPFGWPLRSRQPKDRSNKVLWVADRDEGGPMTIDARRESDAEPLHRELPEGPGPSIVDLPAQGCWRLDLAWPGGRDRIYLAYLGPMA